MADINEIRRANLKKLVLDNEGMANLGRKLGMAKGAYLWQIIAEPPVRYLSEKTARKWERKLHLEEGWLDRDPGVKPPPVPQAVNATLLVQAITAVGEALKHAKLTLAPIQQADLITMQYTDALATGRVDSDRLQRIVDLIRR